MVFSLVLALSLVLLPLSPPVEAVGEAGWALAGVLLAANLASVIALHRRRLASWSGLLAICCATVLGIAAMMWLAGGAETGYEALIVLPLVYSGAVHPPRKTALVAMVALAALGAPLVYDEASASEAGHLLSEFVIWSALAVVAHLLMSGVRAQRLAEAEASELARNEARLDPLTGLYNRRAFDEILAREVERARATDAALTLAMVDIVNFKQVNDRWGYAAGDDCLRAIAAALRQSFREPDLCFRWGGDEFALVLTGPLATEVPVVAERVTEGIAEACRAPDDGPIAARIATTELAPELGATELVERVGRALAEARTATLS